MNPKLASFGLCMLMLLGAFSVLLRGAAADTEPNDTFATAEQISPGAQSGTVNYNTDQTDYYKFSVGLGQIFIINGSSGGPNEVRLTYYDNSQSELADSGWLAQGQFYEYKHTLGQASAGSYYVAVDISTSSSDNIAGYNFTLTVMDQFDAGQLGDAGDTLATARTIMAGTYVGWMSDADAFDFYNFSVVPGATINCTVLTPPTAPDGFRIELYDPKQTYLNETDWAAPGLTATLLHTTSDQTGGVYLISVDKSTTSNTGSNYTIIITLTPQNDSGSGTDVAGDINSAYFLPGEGTYSGYIKDDDQYDYYKFNVSGGQILTLSETTGLTDTGAIRLSIYKPDKNYLMETDWFNPGISGKISYMTNNAGGGQYYLQLEGVNTYTFTINLTFQMDAGALGDAGDNINTARAVNVNTNYTGMMGDADKDDYYGFAGVAGQPASILFMVTSGSSSGKLTLYGSDKNYASDTGTVNPMVPAVLNYTLPALGTYYIDVSTGNNNYTFNISVPTVNDTVNPAIAITSPLNGSTLTTTIAAITGTASDNIALAKVEVSLTGTSWTAAVGTTTWSANLTLVEGNNTIWARATDTSGNINTTSVTVKVSVVAADTEKPTISILVPPDGQKVSKSKLPLISGIATDNVEVQGVTLTVNGVNVPVTFVLGAWLAMNISLKEGKNTIVATATDTSGNTQTATATVTYNKPAPTPGFELLFLVAAIAVGLVLLNRRRA